MHLFWREDELPNVKRVRLEVKKSDDIALLDAATSANEASRVMITSGLQDTSCRRGTRMWQPGRA